MSSNPRTSRIGRRPLTRTLALGAVALAVALIATDLPVRGVSSGVVISQVYGGGGNAGAPYRNDFVELFNRGSAPVTLNGWSVQYASATGTGNFGGNPITTLSGTLQPGQYYLVQLAGGTNGIALPTPDAIGTANMSGTGGKVALVNTTTGLACNGSSTACSATQLAQIVDLVGWDGANFFEGAAAPATSNPTAVFRQDGGCTETDNNAADFAAAAPVPRNTASAVHSCTGPTNPAGTGVANPAAIPVPGTTILTVAVVPGGFPASTGLAVAADLDAIGGSPAQAFYDDGTHGDAIAGDRVFTYTADVTAAAVGAKSLPFTVTDAQSRSGSGAIALAVVPPPIFIHDIQGPGPTSPYVTQFVTTVGVVTARRFNNGFFIQTPDADVDSDPMTSEGVFVYTAAAPPAVAAVGALVRVSGTVSEFVADPDAPPMTEIGSPIVVALATDQPLPAAITLTAADLPSTGTLDQLERYEGMRVFVQALRAVSPTDGAVSEASATSTSNGVFYAVIDDTPRPFREPGVQVGFPLPAGAPPEVPRFDFNPERLRIDSDGQIGASKLEVTSGAMLSNVVGVLDYGYYTWTILPDPTPQPPIAISGLRTATPVPLPADNEFTVASFNMERFYDTVNDPTTSDVALTAAAFDNRLNKASLAIRNVMRTPDILGVQEVENQSTLDALAQKINEDAGAADNPNYVGYLFPGNDVGGINVGVLVKTARVTVDGVVQEGLSDTYVDPNTGLPATLNDRPPIVLSARVHGPTFTVPVTVIVNHLRSLSGIDAETCATAGCRPEGPRVRAKRKAQAEFLANLIQGRQTAHPEERIISVGDYNAYEVNDGYVDVVGTILGRPTPADQVTLSSSDLVNPDLTDLTAGVPAADRYSYSFDGSAQLLDHIIVNGPALQRFSRLHFARSNADFPESYRNDPDVPERISDHDMPVAYFSIGISPVMSDVSPTVSSLWPPNHQLETVGLGYTVASDSGAVGCSVDVVSNEPVNGTGDGDTAPDWFVTSPTSLRLRAERAGTLSGRVYTATVTCENAFGFASKSATVRVPLNRGK